MAKNWLSRPQLLSQMVTEADDFTALRYLKLRQETPRLPEMEEKGGKVLPNIAGALGDLYYSLWGTEPSIKPAEATPASLRYWRQMLESAVKTTAYEQMHAQTQLQELASLIGTISMGQTVLESVPEEDQKKLQELAQADSEAGDAEQQMQQAEADANAAGQLLAELQAAMSGGQPSAQGQAAMAQVQSQMQAAQSQAQASQMTLQEARARAEKLANDLLGTPGTPEAQAKQTQLDRAAQAATQKAADEVKEVSSLLQSWGIEPGELTRQGVPGALDIVKRMRKSEAFKKFKDLLGRMRQIAGRKAKDNARREGRFVPKTEYGRDIASAESDQLAALVHPVLRLKALQSWMRGELRLKGRQFKRSMGKGPVVICEDASGSMDGDKQQWAKAVVLALAYYAKLERRTFAWIMYDSYVRKAKVFVQGNLGAPDMLEIAESRAGGGTNFELPLSKAAEMIQKEGLSKADICFITDGDCAVAPRWLGEFLAKKKKFSVNVITVLMDVGETSDVTVRQFSDVVNRVSSFSAEEAGQKIIGNLI